MRSEGLKATSVDTGESSWRGASAACSGVMGWAGRPRMEKESGDWEDRVRPGERMVWRRGRFLLWVGSERGP